MPTNAKKNVYKEKEFQSYILWKSMPAYFRGMKKEQLISYGFTDPLIAKIASIKNQTSFAKYFRIKDLGTLTDWNQKITKHKLRTDTLDALFAEQAARISTTVSLQPHKALEKKIADQRAVISALRRKILLYEKQSSTQKLTPSPENTIENAVENAIEHAPVLTPPIPLSPIQQPPMNTDSPLSFIPRGSLLGTNEKDNTILKKIQKIFSSWRGIK
jgi:hypothetical protein